MNHPRTLSILTWLALGVAHASAGEAPPAGVVAGFAPADGHILFGELNCAACHSPGGAADRLLTKRAPLLDDVGRRVTPQYLRAFLTNPQHVKPGTAMPDMLHGLPIKERAETIEALVHHLASLGGSMEQSGSGATEYQIALGKTLYHQMGCVSCHATFAPPPKLLSGETPLPDGVEEEKKTAARPSVSLDNLAMKTTLPRLADFLVDPLKTRPSGRMPSLNLDRGEANALAAYLLRAQLSKESQGWGAGLDYAFYQGKWSKLPDFRKLTPKQQGTTASFDLKGVVPARVKSDFAVRFSAKIEIPKTGKYTFFLNSDDGSVLRIDDKVVVDNDGTHPPAEKSGTVTLTEGRHDLELGFFQSGGGYELAVAWQPPGAKTRAPLPPGLLLRPALAMIPKGRSEFKVDADRAAQGRKLFAKVGCVSCHPLGKPTGGHPWASSTAAAVVKLDPAAAGGCLAEKVAAGRPRFGLSPQQRTALQQAVAALKKPAPAEPVEVRVTRTMTAFNCYACHQRGKVGGPEPAHAAYFNTLFPVDLGEEGRLPPSLHEVGAKLTPAGFDAILFKGDKFRPYMATRMPLFGKDNLASLPEWFADADAGKVHKREVKFAPKLADEGHFLAGKQALGCINCHSWGGVALSGVHGVDLQQLTTRLQPGWFHAFMADPQKRRPRTRMPSSWPDGKSFYPTIQQGAMDKQIDALWAYLSLGPRAPTPDGLTAIAGEYLLRPVGEPLVFRTFLQGVGAHAITVGFPQRTNIAFDALRVRLARAWSGDFISARAAWEGRAGEYAKVTAASQVEFPLGPVFAVLPSQDTRWPSIDMKAKHAPSGWKFRGYRYDATRTPVFLYRFQDIDIEETPGTEARPDGSFLLRRFHLSAPAEVANLYLRVAAGTRIVAEKDGSFTVDDRLHFRVQSSGEAPFVRAVPGGQELLIPIRFRAAKGGKTPTADLEVQLTW
ncbi:MAG TPA: PA14 domain-containing protein [Gemmataceae bacterium]|nr:PA14 domain-containing protein [Gemmataceae bacterium]